MSDWYEGGDTRGPRPLALIRYEHYRTWLDMYSKQSWILILDTRDTFFQVGSTGATDRTTDHTMTTTTRLPLLPLRPLPNSVESSLEHPVPHCPSSATLRSSSYLQLNPFSPNLLNRNEGFDVHLFEENRSVKRVGICPFNSGWLACWGKDVPKRYANNSVVCSGSTLGHHEAVVTYADRMIREFDSQQCHVIRGTESDQGYHNYLYHTGKFAEAGLRIKANPQGTGVVNTIGKQIPTLCLAPTLTLSLSHSLATPLSGSSRPVIHTRAIQQGL